MKNKVVDNPRVICGLLAELEASHALALLKPEKEGTVEFTAALGLEITRPYESSLVRIQAEPHVGVLDCEVTLGAKRLSFRLAPSEKDEEKYSLPSSVSIVDLRASKRLSFRKEHLSAEIRIPGGILLGEPHDVSFDFISILLNEANVPSKLGTHCQVLVRSPSHFADIYFGDAAIVGIHEAPGGTKVVLRITSQSRRLEVPRPSRHHIEPVTIRFEASQLGHSQISGAIRVEEVSVTGFVGTLQRATLGAPVLGLALHSTDPHMAFYPVRQAGEKTAFRVVSSETRPGRRSWTEFVEHHANPEFRSLLDNTELADLFTESTFIKGSRRKMFGSNLDAHLLNPNKTENRNLLRRFLRADDGANISHHISIFRFTDHAWYLQEVISGLYKLSGMSGFKDEILKVLQNEARFVQKTPTYFAGMYDPTIEVNKQIWGAFVNSNDHIGCSAAHVKAVGESKGPCIENSNYSLSRVDNLTFSEKLLYFAGFNSKVLELLDFWSCGQTNRDLNSELLSVGQKHAANLLYISRPGALSADAVIYRLLTYYPANATGVMSSNFVILPSGVSNQALASLIELIQNHPELSLGTPDMLLIGSDLKPLPNIEGKKDFIWFAVNLRKLEGKG